MDKRVYDICGYPPKEITYPIMDGADEDFIIYRSEGKFWGGGRLLKSNAWDDACNNFHLPLWQQQDLLEHIESKRPGFPLETITYGEIKEFCRDIFEYDKELGALYKNIFPKIKTCSYGNKIKPGQI